MIDYILFVLYTAFIFFIGKRLGEKSPDCAHTWQTVGKISDEKRDKDEWGASSYTLKHGYQLRCEKCGEMKARWMQ